MCRAIPRLGTWAALTRQRGVESVHLHGHSVARGRLCRPAKTWWRPNTWTGYTDKELLEQVGAGSWYDIYYRYLSSGVHVDATTISEDLHALARGRAEVGRRYRQAIANRSHTWDKFRKVAGTRPGRSFHCCWDQQSQNWR